MIRYTRFHSGITLLLCVALGDAPLAFAQTAGPPATPAQAGRVLKVVVLDGNEGFNSVRNHTAVQPVVEVRDEDDRPLSGATVTFQLPAVGPGASFPDGKSEQHTVANTQGQATTKGMTPNTQTGRFNIRVTAKLGNREGSTTIAQNNVDVIPAAKPKSSSKWWKYALLAGAAGGAAGAVALTRGDGSATAAPVNSLTIVPGTISVSGPR